MSLIIAAIVVYLVSYKTYCVYHSGDGGGDREPEPEQRLHLRLGGGGPGRGGGGPQHPLHIHGMLHLAGMMATVLCFDHAVENYPSHAILWVVVHLMSAHICL